MVAQAIAKHMNVVLIVAKCIVNIGHIVTVQGTSKVLIVAKCIVNSYKFLDSVLNFSY